MKKYGDFYKTVPCSPCSYFIGANTKSGFAHNPSPYFNESRFTKLFIIKGGPGTGKSTIMKNAARLSEDTGAKVTRLYCSSDPDSLDGIIIEKGNLRVGITDGTAPHTMDSGLPGCCGEIINCGDAWNSSVLEEKRDEIAALCAKKAIAFERSYAFIAAADKVKKTIDKNLLLYTDAKKLRSYVSRLVKKLPKEKGEKEFCITEAISMKGGIRLGSFDNASLLYGITDYGNIKNEFLKLLSHELEKHSISHKVSVSPMGDISEIYLPSSDYAFVCAREGAEYHKIINMKRFSNEKIADGKAKRRFNERFFTDLMYAATDALAEAKKYHFELEEIYKSAMDFEVLNSIGESLYNKIDYIIKKAR